jgi:hypothetical protein
MEWSGAPNCSGRAAIVAFRSRLAQIGERRPAFVQHASRGKPKWKISACYPLLADALTLFKPRPLPERKTGGFRWRRRSAHSFRMRPASPARPSVPWRSHLSRASCPPDPDESRCANPGSGWQPGSYGKERVGHACDRKACHPPVFNMFRLTRCGSARLPPAPTIRTSSRSRSVGWLSPRPPRACRLDSPALNSPMDLNVLRRGASETDSIRSPQHTADRALRHNRNAVRAFRNAFPTYQEREVRHKGNEPSNLQERKPSADSCKSGDSEPASQAANSLTL